MKHLRLLVYLIEIKQMYLVRFVRSGSHFGHDDVTIESTIQHPGIPFHANETKAKWSLNENISSNLIAYQCSLP
jgi:hypothetical protein